jgi:hypothetical protein
VLTRKRETNMHNALALFLRATAILLLLAVVAVFLPHAWMDAIHGWLGLGTLPGEPIVSYLARSVSALYAVAGATYWFVAGDVRRYLPFLRFAVWMTLGLAGLLTAADVLAGMPAWWTLGEVGFTLGWSLALWRLVRRAERESTKPRGESSSPGGRAQD